MAIRKQKQTKAKPAKRQTTSKAPKPVPVSAKPRRKTQAEYKREQRAARLKQLTKQLGSKKLARKEIRKQRCTEKQRERGHGVLFPIVSTAPDGRVQLYGTSPWYEDLETLCVTQGVRKPDCVMVPDFMSMFDAMRLASVRVPLSSFKKQTLVSYAAMLASIAVWFVRSRTLQRSGLKTLAQQIERDAVEIFPSLARDPLKFLHWFASLAEPLGLLSRTQLFPKLSTDNVFLGLLADAVFSHLEFSGRLDRRLYERYLAQWRRVAGVDRISRFVCVRWSITFHWVGYIAASAQRNDEAVISTQWLAPHQPRDADGSIPEDPDDWENRLDFDHREKEPDVGTFESAGIEEITSLVRQWLYQLEEVPRGRPRSRDPKPEGESTT